MQWKREVEIDTAMAWFRYAMAGQAMLRRSNVKTGNAKAKISNEMKCGGLALTCAAVELSRCDESGTAKAWKSLSRTAKAKR